MGEFVGKRVVPDHVGVWNQKKTYEPLMIVLDGETGDSYISRKAVPVGISLSDESYWSLCAHYSAQMRKLEQDVDEDVQQMHSDVTAVKNAMSLDQDSETVAIAVVVCGSCRPEVPDGFDREGPAVCPGDRCWLHVAG